MPFLPDGRPVDMVLNPLGVPSRMNIGQILETHLGLVAAKLGLRYVNPIFKGASEAEILVELEKYAKVLRTEALYHFATSELNIDMGAYSPDSKMEDMLDKINERLATLSAKELEDIARRVNASPVMDPEAYDALVARLQEAAETGEEVPLKPAPKRYKLGEIMDRTKEIVLERTGFDQATGKTRLIDGMSGEPYNQPVTVGVIYMMKLAHLVDDKIHARSTGPYSLVTQQPLGGKAQFGGQRFGEMEVWALEAYGAAYTLQEILTIKSDDVLGRVKTYESIVKGDSMLEPGVPESFKILVNELQSLGLKVTVEDSRAREIDLNDREEDSSDSDESRRILVQRRRQLAGSTGGFEEGVV